MDLFTLVARLTMDSSEYEKGIGKAGKSFAQFGKTISARAVAIGTMAAHAIEKAASAAVKLGSSAIDAAAAVEAERAQFVATFGDMQGAAEKAFDGIEKSTGIFGTRLKSVGTKAFSQFKGAGLDGVDALGMMEEYTKLAADAAAYYDISLEDADARLRSFLRGNTEAGDAIGLFTSESQRSTAAMEKYGKKWTELTEAQKQMLMLDVAKGIYEQSGAIGQASREADAWANVVGNLKEVWRQTLAVVGAPIVSAITPVIEKLTNFLGNEDTQLKFQQFGLDIADIANATFDGVSGFFGQLVTNEKTLGTLLGETIVSAAGALQTIGSVVFTGVESFFNTLTGGSVDIAAALISAKSFFDGVTGMEDNDSTVIGAIANAIDKAATAAGTIAGLVFDSAITFFNTLTGGETGLVNVFNGAASFFEDIAKLNDEGQTSGIGAVAEALGKIGSVVLTEVINFLSLILGGDGEGENTALENINSFFTDLGTFASNHAEAIGTVIAAIMGLMAVTNPFAALILALGFIVTQWNDIKALLVMAKNWFERFLNVTIPEKFLSPVSDAWSSVKKTVSDAVTGFGEFIGTTIPTAFLHTVKNAWDFVKLKIDAAKRKFDGFISKVIPTDFLQGVKDAWDSVVSKIQTAIGKVQEFLGIKIDPSFEGGTSYDPEYPTISGGMGDYSAGWDSGYDVGNLPGKAIGLDYVPYNNYFARLHEGEAVLTKAEATAWRQGAPGAARGVDYAAIGAAVGNAVRDALDGIGLYTDDGTRIADLVTERVSRNIARSAQNRRYAT